MGPNEVHRLLAIDKNVSIDDNLKVDSNEWGKIPSNSFSGHPKRFGFQFFFYLGFLLAKSNLN